MPKIKVDGQELEVENGTTLLQACELAGREVPRSSPDGAVRHAAE